MSDRRRQISLTRQLRLVLPLVMLWMVGGAALAVAGLQTAIPREELFLDTTAISGLPWYAGVLSNVGILAWTVAAVAALGGGWVSFQTLRPSAGRFLTAGGLVASILLLDDLLRLHSSVIPKVLGVPKAIAMLLVVAPAILWFLGFIDEVLRTRWLVLLAALGAFFGSVAADQLLPSGPNTLLIEDGAKLLGVLAWSLYFVLTTRDIATSTIRAATTVDPVTRFATETTGEAQRVSRAEAVR
ncbi:MAG: hypothetical protein R2770_13010 [Acidimicrobiales bacterium]|nr:hypothetical protein [Acidimicrobiales bacterium]